MDFNIPQSKHPSKPMSSPKPPEPQRPLYAAPDPYPPVKVECPNPHYAQMLKTPFASPKSEVTSITQYVYQSWVLQSEFPEISDALHHTAIVEMHHLDILGRLIDCLGGTPSYSCIQRNRQIPWNGSMVFYARMVRQIMQNNILAEQDAIRQYKKMIQSIQDPHICANLERIILDEEVHIEILKKYL